MSCRIHGHGCRTPWGFDPAHTDQRHPYTLNELAARSEPPHRYAYPTTDEYVKGFHLYRAIRRDDLLTAGEIRAKLEVLADELHVPREILDEL